MKHTEKSEKRDKKLHCHKSAQGSYFGDLTQYSSDNLTFIKFTNLICLFLV